MLTVVGALSVNAAQAASKPADTWSQFKDANISLDYPQHIKPQHTFTQTYLLPTSWSLLANKPLLPGQKTLVQFTLLNKTIKTQYLGLQKIRVFLRIGVSSRKTDVVSCYQPQYIQHVKTVQLNGSEYKTFDYSDSAMMHALTATVYRYTINASCYSIELINIYPNAKPAGIQPLLRQADGLGQAMLRTLTIAEQSGTY